MGKPRTPEEAYSAIASGNKKELVEAAVRLAMEFGPNDPTGGGKNLTELSPGGADNAAAFLSNVPDGRTVKAVGEVLQRHS